MMLTPVAHRHGKGIFLALALLLPVFCIYSPISAAGSSSRPGCDSAATTHFAGRSLADNRQYMGIRMLGSLRLGNVSCKSMPLMGLSGLAWSADTGILYAISDRGNLFHLQPVFTRDLLTNVHVKNAYPLRGPDDRPLDTEHGDSEGLALINGSNGIRGDEILLISFERRPRISRYRTHGLWLGDEALIDPLADVGHYALPNRALESVALHPEYGILTAPERPLKKQDNQLFRIYGQHSVIAEMNPADEEFGALTGLTVTPNGDLLVLERIFSGVFGVLAAVIHRIDPGSHRHNIVVRLDSAEGHIIDSFEGISHHRDDRYFIVSDNNGNALQRTLLFYFAITGEQ